MGINRGRLEANVASLDRGNRIDRVGNCQASPALPRLADKRGSAASGFSSILERLSVIPAYNQSSE